MADLISSFESSCKTQVSVMEVIGPNISNYGKVIPNSKPESVAGLVEKPDADKAPSNLASFSRYIFTPNIFDILRSQPAEAGGEIQLADAINVHAAYNEVEAVTLHGSRFDCGSVQGFLEAIMHVAKIRVP